MKKNDSKLDVLFAGHAIEDTIFDGDFPRKQWGGIYNCLRAAKQLNAEMVFGPETSINAACEPLAFGKANIIIDRQSSTKEVHAELGFQKRTAILPSARWTHLLYSNEMLGWGALPGYGFKSTDLCKGRFPVSLGFDYVFLSDDEFCPKKLSWLFKEPTFIAHNPSAVSLWKKGEKIFDYTVPNKILECNPLGAGDFFATAYILYMLFEGINEQKAAEFAVKMTHSFLISN